MKRTGLLSNQSITVKLFLGVGLMIGVCLVIAGTGHLGFSRLNREAETMYQKRFLPVVEIVGMKTDLMEARAFLMALIHEQDVEKQKKMREQIETVSAHLDETLATYESSGFFFGLLKEKQDEFKNVWNEFKKTRDRELIPFIFQGDIKSAVALATGVQAQRLAQMLSLANAMIQSVEEDASKGHKETQALTAALIKAFWIISLLGIGVAMILSIGLTLHITIRLKRVMVLAKKLASGDLGDRLEVDSQDEMGQMSAALNQAVEKMQQLVLSMQKSAEVLKNSQNQLVQSEKMAAIGQLAGGVAHEINNPLGVILGFSQNIAKRIQPGDPLEMPVKSIEREALRCKNLVQDLLTFSRAGKGESESIDLKEAIDLALSLVLAQAKVKKVELVKEFSEVPKITGNKNQIQQIIVNFSTNAMDAMPHGGKLVIRLREAKIEGKDAVEIQVQDTGEGIPSEIRDKIFNPFFTTKEIGKGTGLGLSLVFEIVKKHGGRILVESEVGKGTTFQVFLPLIQ